MPPVLKRDTTKSSSGDDIRNIRIDNQLDLILEQQFSSLEARDFKLIADRLRGKQLNSGIEIPVFSLQDLEHADRMIIVHRVLFSPSSSPQEP